MQPCAAAAEKWVPNVLVSVVPQRGVERGCFKAIAEVFSRIDHKFDLM